MASAAPEIWDLTSYILAIAGAVTSGTVGAWLAARRDRFGTAGAAMVAALALTAVWSVALAASGYQSLLTAAAETVRNLAWILVIYRLFAMDGRLEKLGPVRPVVLVLAVVEVLHLAFATIVEMSAIGPAAREIAHDFIVLFRLLVTVGALVLVHNLVAGAAPESRLALRWPAAGLAVLWAFELNLYTIAYLSSGWPVEFAASRGLAVLALAALVLIGASGNRDVLRIRPSRVAAFQTFSLIIIGIYLVAMVTIAQWLAYAGGDFARLTGLGFLTIASVSAILVLPSRRLRGWLRVMLAKHLFQHRYDYRAEWLRFTRTIGNATAQASPLGERAIQAVAEITDSPAGLLLAAGEHGELTLAARWQWNEIEVPAAAMAAAAVQFFEREGFIADLDDVRAGRGSPCEPDLIPAWLLDHPRAWALVPLLHYERLVGLIVLARPPVPRKFDWEDFDLLRVVGQQLASYLAEHGSQEALAEASRFDDFHRRIAFVMHDIKNLASQLSLLARNAEIHAEKPEFRDDMLVTLRNSADKLNALLARLSRYGTGVERVDEVEASEVASAAVARFQGVHQVAVVESQACTVMANRDSLEQVLVHLIQNGIDASAADSPVFLSVTSDGLHASYEVVDSGSGMSPEFVRTRLFKPFVSSKPGGFGIGAFEARELVRAMRGRLDVESREGLGTRFVVRLPLATTTHLIASIANSGQRETP